MRLAKIVLSFVLPVTLSACAMEGFAPEELDELDQASTGVEPDEIDVKADGTTTDCSAVPGVEPDEIDVKADGTTADCSAVPGVEPDEIDVKADGSTEPITVRGTTSPKR